MQRLLIDLARALPLTLAVVAVLLAVALVVVLVLVRRARLPGIGLPEADDLPLGEEVVWVDLRSNLSAVLRRTFRRAQRVARRAGTAGDPRVLLVGQSASGKTTFVEHAPLSLPSGQPETPEVAGAPALGWWPFDDATVLDVPGAWVLRSDGASSDGAAWMSLLHLTRRSRPRRPADGVIVTVPADALLATTVAPATGSNPAPAPRSAAQLRADAARCGARLYDKLVQIQQVLGMCLPVTVLLTRADRVPGFTDLVDHLPPDERQQVFGWSVPDAPDTPYRDDWATAAIASLVRTAERLAPDESPPAEAATGESTSETAGEAATGETGTGETANGEASNRFAESLEAMAPQVHITLSQLFARGVPGDSYFLRGLYLCGGGFGDEADDPACRVPPPPEQAPARPQEVFFIGDLLRRKVFPETFLGRPSERAEATRHGRVRLAQALCLLVPLVGGLGLWWAHGRTASAAGTLEPLVHLVERDLASERSGGAGRDPETRKAEALEILAQARGVERYRLRTPLLPASLSSPVDDRVEQVMVDGTGAIVLPALHRSLELATVQLQRTTPVGGTAGETITAPEKTPQFRRLAEFVAAVRVMERNRAAYRCLEVKCGSHRRLLTDFQTLTRSLWDEPFSLPNGSAERFWGGVLRRAPAPAADRSSGVGQSSGTSDRLSQIARDLTGDFYRVLFVTNPVLEELEWLERELDSLEAAGGLEGADAATYRLLNQRIQTLEKHLADPDLDWMIAEQLDLGSGMDEVWQAMDRSSDLGPVLRAELEADGERDFERLQRQLPQLSTVSTGPLLAQKNGRVELALSDGVDQVDNAVRSLLAQSFMTPNQMLVPWDPDPQERFTWDVSRLKMAAATIPSYDDYVAKGIDAFPPELRSSTADTALESLGVQVLDQVARAQQFAQMLRDGPLQSLEQDVESRATNFQDADKPLGDIVNGLGRLGLSAEAAEISGIVTRQELQLLKDTDHLLTREDLYRPRDGGFSWWDGLHPPSPEAFGVTTSKQLSSYLDDQLQIVTRLGDAVQPALDGLARSGGVLDPDDAARVAKWTTILSDLEAAKDKVAGNPVTTLEDLVGKTLTALTLDGCFDTAAPEQQSVLRHDYFEGRMRRLEETLHEQCVDLAAGYGSGCYAQMAALFDERLAGQFPFAAQEPGLFDTVAQPDALTAFYKIFDRSSWMFPDVPEERHAFGAHEKEIRRFVDLMGAFRPLVAPYLDDPEKYPAPALGFSVEFRVNRQEESGAEDVLDWQLGVGPKVYSRGGSTLTGNWVYGTPASLTLGWAQDAPVEPLGIQAGERGRITGRQVIYQYDDPWALLSLLRDHETVPADFPRFVDADPYTLKSIVKTRPVEGKTSGKSCGTSSTSPCEAKLFVRLELLTPDRKQVVPWPPAFPTEAPRQHAHPAALGCPEALPVPSPAPAATGKNPTPAQVPAELSQATGGASSNGAR